MSLMDVANINAGNVVKTLPAAQPTSAEVVGVSDDTVVQFSDSGEETLTTETGAPVERVATETPTQETPATTPEEPKLFDTPEAPADEPVVEETPTQPQQQHQLGKVPVGPRDYSKYDKELLPILKDLPNAKFAQFADKIAEWHNNGKKLADLQKQFDERPNKPQYYYENPDAYQLSPEFRSLQENIQYAQFEVNHFQAQLPRIKRGENWVEITGYDANGAPQYVERKAPENGQPDYDAEVRVSGILNNSRTALQQLSGQASTYAQQYQQSAQGAQAELKKIDERFFPKMQNVEKDLSPEEQKLYKLALSAAPVYLDGHPLMHMLAKSAVAQQRTVKLYADSLKEITRLKGLLAGRKVTEPKPGGVTNAAAQVADDVVKFDEINP